VNTRFAVIPLAIMLAARSAGTVKAQATQLDASCTPKMTPLQQRLYQKGNEGPGVLRNFIFIRRGIYQLDIFETAEWVNAVNAARVACVNKVSQVQPGPQAPGAAG